jgi:benzoylformate decarboxylase
VNFAAAPDPLSDAAPQPTVRDCVFDVMRAFGATTLFGNPGSTELPMFRNFPSDFRYVLGLHEAVAAGMADGFSQATGKVAFLNLHSAAGVGNAMGNIYTAFKNRTPLVIIAGQQSRSILPLDPYLASDQATELPKPYVKWSIEPARAHDVAQAIATACHRALQAPGGPVLVSVPCDDWDRPATPVAPRVVSRSSRPDPAVLSEIAAALDRCERPAFVVGAEVDRDGAWEELERLAQHHGAAVFHAPFSARAGIREDHPLFMGFLPAAREQIVQKLAGHDLVLVVGAPVFT